jgi:hypothetical protein
MTMSTTVRLLGAIALVAAASACGGGGGGGGDDGGVIPAPTTASFAASDPTPPAGSVSLQQGSRSGLVVNVLVSASGINDFFGAGLRLTYDPALVRFEGSDTSVSFLRDPPFDAPGAPLLFTIAESTPGILNVAATRLQNAQGTATGVNVAGTRTLVSLQFRLLAATAGTQVTLPPAQREVRDSQANLLAPTFHAGAFLAN